MELVLQGEGKYGLSAIKDIEVTDQFLGLGDTVTLCQTEEYRVDCLSRVYREKVLSQCKCSPFEMRSYYGDQVTAVIKECGWKLIANQHHITRAEASSPAGAEAGCQTGFSMQ